MIIDNIANLGQYQELEKFRDAFDYIAGCGAADFIIGKHEIEGNKLTCAFIEYGHDSSRGIWESHRKHVDIHFIISGSERINIADVKNTEPAGEYNAESDSDIYKNEVNSKIQLRLNEGDFLVLFPWEIHCTNDEGTQVYTKKAVLKVKI